MGSVAPSIDAGAALTVSVPDLSVPGAGALLLQNTGRMAVRVEHVDALGPLVVGPMRPASLGGGGTLPVDASWTAPTRIQAQLLVRTPERTFVLPEAASFVPAGGPPTIPLDPVGKTLVDAAIKRQMGAIRACYQAELADDHRLSGAVTLHFVIATDGPVVAMSVKATTFSHGHVEACLTEKLLGLEFGEWSRNGITVVNYPFVFAPS